MPATKPTKSNQPVLSSEQAATLLLSQDCRVTLSITTGIYETRHANTAYNLIYVDGFNEYVHFHNIKAIYCLNIDKPQPAGEFIEIDWSDDERFR